MIEVEKKKVDWLNDHNLLVKQYHENLGISCWLRENTFDSFVYREIFEKNDYYLPYEEESRFRKYVEKLNYRRPQVVMDIGANIGLSSIYFHAMYPNAKIYAVEPEIDNFRMLEYNTADIPVCCLHAAIWNNRQNLYVQEKSQLITRKGKLNTARYTVSPEGTQNMQKVTSISMTELMEKYQLDCIDILKVDIQGAEVELFDDSSIQWLPKVRILIIEQHDYYRPGCSRQIMRALSQVDFYFLGSRDQGLLLFFLIKGEMDYD